MWMTPFYLFIGILCVYIFQNKIHIERLRYFISILLFIFILSPSIYFYHSISKKDQRTDYPGKEIARFIQTKWDNNFSNKIEIVFWNEWDAGNLSYNLKTRPKWTKEVSSTANVGIIEIWNYDDNIYVNKICATSNSSFHIVLLQLKSFNHNVCMVGKKWKSL